MRYARGPGPDPQLIEAERGHTGTCPGCGSALVAKCGTIVSPHWAHHARPDCDDWSEPESEWHLAWKRHAPPERTEVVMGANREHRADVVLPNGWVLELQHSALSAEAIREREEFYTREAGGMCWLWDARRFWKAAEIKRSGSDVMIGLGRHRTLYEPRCGMYWDIPEHPIPEDALGYGQYFASGDYMKYLQRERDYCAQEYATCVRQAASDDPWVQRSGRYWLQHAWDCLARAERDIVEGPEHALRQAELCTRLDRTRMQLAAGVIAHVVPTDAGFFIEQLIPRDQFAAAIRGPQ
jgi:hypothetical protein